MIGKNSCVTVSRMRAMVAKPSMPGIITSSSTKSGDSVASRSRASLPDWAQITSYPRRVSRPLSTIRLSSSSSTTRISGWSRRCILPSPLMVFEAAARGALRRNRHEKSGALARLAFHPHTAVMQRGDAAHDA